MSYKVVKLSPRNSSAILYGHQSKVHGHAAMWPVATCGLNVGSSDLRKSRNGFSCSSRVGWGLETNNIRNSRDCE